MIVCDLCKKLTGNQAKRVTLVSQPYPMPGARTGMGPPEDLACFDMCEECLDATSKALYRRVRELGRDAAASRRGGPSPVNKHSTDCSECGAAPLAHHLSGCSRPLPPRVAGRNPDEPEGRRPVPTPPPPPPNETTTRPAPCDKCGRTVHVRCPVCKEIVCSACEHAGQHRCEVPNP